MAKKKQGSDGSTPQKASLAQNLGAIVVGLLAVKIATYIVTTIWRLVTREEPPQVDEDAPAGKKAAWIALVGAASGASRQAARDLVKPAPSGSN